MATYKKPPYWLRQACQGLTYWIGHRRALYRHWPLSEGALVAELCNLIYAKVGGSGHHLLCERQYSQFLTGISAHNDLSTSSRIDLLIVDEQESYDAELTIHYAIEVKRLSAGETRIHKDFRRIAAVLKEREGARGFVLVVSERERPTQFTTSKGRLPLDGLHPVRDSTAKFRVGAVKKASALFSKPNYAHYVCLIEVFP